MIVRSRCTPVRLLLLLVVGFTAEAQGAARAGSPPETFSETRDVRIERLGDAVAERARATGPPESEAPVASAPEPIRAGRGSQGKPGASRLALEPTHPVDDRVAQRPDGLWSVLLPRAPGARRESSIREAVSIETGRTPRPGDEPGLEALAVPGALDEAPGARAVETSRPASPGGAQVASRHPSVRVAQQQPAPPPPRPAPAPVSREPTPSPPLPPREPLAPPSGVRPFPAPPQFVGREATLEQTISVALENQPSIRVRLAEYAAARHRAAQALAPLFPQLAFRAGFFRSRDFSSTTEPVFGQSRRSTRISTTASALFTAEQRIFDFGKTAAGTAAARSRAESSRETVEVEKDDIVLAVKDAYFNLLFAKRRVIVNEAALDRANLNLRSARGFFDVGTRPKSDVTRAEVDVANARVELIRAQNDVSLFRIALNTAMGIAIDTPTEVKDILTYEPFPVDREALVSEALRRRAEYRLAKFESDAAEATVRQAFRDFFPELFAVGSHSVGRTDSRADARTDGWEAGVELRWSIFDGGRKIARHEETKAVLEAVQASVRTLELSIWQEVEQAHVRLVDAEERIGAAAKAVESAQENFRLSQGRFDAGVGNIIELTDAQLALTRAQTDEALALRDFRIAIAGLERALGRR